MLEEPGSQTRLPENTGEVAPWIEITPNPVSVNARFTLEILLPNASFGELRLEPEFPPEVRVVRGPSVVSWGRQRSGEFGPGLLVAYSLRVDEAGRFPVGPFPIALSSGEWWVEATLLEVGVPTSDGLVFPLEVEWVATVDPPTIYMGETLPLTLMVTSQREISLFSPPGVKPPSSGIFEAAEGVAEIYSTTIGGVTLYDLPVASFIFTPTEIGQVHMDRSRVVGGAASGRADALSITVIPSPDEIASTGAIGRFSLTGESTQVEAGGEGEYHYSVILSGEGNLNYLRIPDVVVSGGDILAVSERQDYSPTKLGFEGERRREFTLAAGDGETMRVVVPPFPYLSTENDEVITIGNFVDILEIGLVQEEDELSNDTVPGIGDSREPVLGWLNYREKPLLWLLLLPGCLVFLIVRYGPRLGRFLIGGGLLVALSLLAPANLWSDTPGQMLKMVEESIQEDEPLEATLAILHTVPEADRNSRWYGATGFLYGEHRQWDESIWNLQTAVAKNPGSRVYRVWLQRMEKLGGIRNPHPPPVRLGMEVFFLLLLIGVNGAGIATLFVHLRRGRYASVVLIMFILLTVVATSFLGVIEVERGHTYGVVMGGEEDEVPYLRKIPWEGAEEWILLVPGTTVVILDSLGGFCLVRNGSATTGWVYASQIRGVPEISEFAR